MHDLRDRSGGVGLGAPGDGLAQAEHPGAVKTIVTLSSHQPSPHLVCQNDSLFSSEEKVTRFLPSGLNARAVTGAWSKG